MCIIIIVSEIRSAHLKLNCLKKNIFQTNKLFRIIILLFGEYRKYKIYKKGDKKMRKPRKRSFQELVLENKMQLLKDREAIAKIEERIESKHLKKAR